MVRKSAAGFTLIELIVVIVILAIMAAVVIPRVIGRAQDARISSAMSDIKSFDDALDMYKADIGEYPTNDQGLNALLTKSDPKWNGPYLKNQTSIPLDPWGTPYKYQIPGGSGRDYDISSAGPDKQFGTADDIQSWNISGK
ncbi:MAG: type II secretion system major pseudopilin GspG [Armatimonadetes bacterium]|nr:type II secretion system major pseudopilin GspG [Armatimonadota bacterium]MDE2207765.1 type II secretion system major pseudopilin GspG [Armatimonadota bacterium]